MPRTYDEIDGPRFCCRHMSSQDYGGEDYASWAHKLSCANIALKPKGVVGFNRLEETLQAQYFEGKLSNSILANFCYPGNPWQNKTSLIAE